MNFGGHRCSTTRSKAAGYSNEENKRLLGDTIDSARRDEPVLASKVCFGMHDGPNGNDLSKKHIIDQCHATLGRLGVGYLDLKNNIIPGVIQYRRGRRREKAK